MRRLLGNSDFLAGALFVLLGACFFLSSVRFEFGTASQMGPGYFPLVLSGALFLLGTAQIFLSARQHAPGGESPARFYIRPAVFVLGGMAAFAASLERLGLIVAAILLVVIAGVVAQGRRWTEIGAVAVALAVFAALVFVKGLGVFMPLWPEAL